MAWHALAISLSGSITTDGTVTCGAAGPGVAGFLSSGIYSDLGLLRCFQRALAAFLAISTLRFADNFLALAFPPFRPPSRPNATAAGFLSSPVSLLSAAKAATFSSVEGLLERLGIAGRLYLDS